MQSEGATSLPAEDQVVRPSELLAAAVNESSSSSDEECNEEDDAQEELTAEEDVIVHRIVTFSFNFSLFLNIGVLEY